MSETCAGAILYTKQNETVLYLVIRDNHGNFGFPKGHLEQGEDLLQAAHREIREETGIDASIDLSFQKELNYIMPNGIPKRSVYFIANYSDQDPIPQEGEVEEILLLPYEETLSVLTFENMKEVLMEADRYRKEKENE